MTVQLLFWSSTTLGRCSILWILPLAHQNIHNSADDRMICDWGQSLFAAVHKVLERILFVCSWASRRIKIVDHWS